MAKAMTIEQYQNKIDEKYGKGEWVVEEYTGASKPLVIVHSCGREKRLSRASSFEKSNSCKCVSTVGRPKLTFEELDKRIQKETYGTYRLIELIDSNNFTVEHKSCDRKPFKTTISRFFSRGQRCACSKKMVVGKKRKDDIDYSN